MANRILKKKYSLSQWCLPFGALKPILYPCNDITSNPNLKTMHECLPLNLSSLTQWAMSPLWWEPHISLTRNQGSLSVVRTHQIQIHFFVLKLLRNNFSSVKTKEGERERERETERVTETHKWEKKKNLTWSLVFQCPPPPHGNETF